MPLSTTEETAITLGDVTVTGFIKKHKKTIVGVVVFAALLAALYFVTKTKAIV